MTKADVLVPPRHRGGRGLEPPDLVTGSLGASADENARVVQEFLPEPDGEAAKGPLGNNPREIRDGHRRFS